MMGETVASQSPSLFQAGRKPKKELGQDQFLSQAFLSISPASLFRCPSRGLILSFIPLTCVASPQGPSSVQGAKDKPDSALSGLWSHPAPADHQLWWPVAQTALPALLALPHSWTHSWDLLLPSSCLCSSLLKMTSSLCISPDVSASVESWQKTALYSKGLNG